jgi:hypothetical protein
MFFNFAKNTSHKLSQQKNNSKQILERERGGRGCTIYSALTIPIVYAFCWSTAVAYLGRAPQACVYTFCWIRIDARPVVTILFQCTAVDVAAMKIAV